MEKAKAVEILNEAYDGFLIAEKVCSDAFKDEITDRKIALLTAIDALEQSPTVEAEPMGEYISKQSVIDYLNGYLHSIGEDGTYSPLFDRGQRRALINSIQDISVIKGADVQPVKHGLWIIDYAEGSKIYHAHCSECNNEPARNIGGDYYIDKLSDYCPNCGAKMDGDRE